MSSLPRWRPLVDRQQVLTAPAEIRTDARSAKGRLGVAAARRGRNAPVDLKLCSSTAYVADGLPAAIGLVASQCEL